MNVVNVGLRIKERRKELKISAEELGKRLGKDRSTIYRYEKGEIKNLPIELLMPIAIALETTPERLIGREEVAPFAKISKRSVFYGKISKNKEFWQFFGMYTALPDDKKEAIYKMVEDYYETFSR
ncbi:MAG: helix-turn-helix domain-containing protein [Ruminococcus sp.]|nr:helix-turn-helix domain-containing protein [Ruminococcus sp.]